MNIYLYPALIALLINFAVIWAASKGMKKTKSFIPLVISFSLLNLCEVVSILLISNPEYNEHLVRAYYILAMSSIALVGLYSAEVSEFQNKGMTYFIISVVIAVSITTFFTDIIVAGIRPLGHSTTAIKGVGYIVFQIFIISVLASIGFMLIAGYRKAVSHQQQIKCAATLAAMLPIFLVCLVLVVLMGLGYRVNAVGIIPLSMVAFILIMLVSEESHMLTDIRRFITGSPERRSSNEVMNICNSYARDQVSYRDAISEIERVLVVHKYQKNNKNASMTAELMGMPRSSLYSIFNRLKIESKNN